VVREAIARLKADGCMETRQGAGAFVAGAPGLASFRLAPDGPIEPGELAQLFELRAAVEVATARLAAERARAPSSRPSAVRCGGVARNRGQDRRRGGGRRISSGDRGGHAQRPPAALRQSSWAATSRRRAVQVWTEADGVPAARTRRSGSTSGSSARSRADQLPRHVRRPIICAVRPAGSA
jgi:hypothetical protein